MPCFNLSRLIITVLNRFVICGLIFFTIFCFEIDGFSQSISIPTPKENDDAPLTQIEKIDSDAELLRIRQLNERDLRDTIVELEKEQSNLETEILDLQRRRDELQNSITRLNELKQNLPNNSSLESRQNLVKDLEEKEEELITVKTDLATKQSTFEANSNSLFLAQQQLGERSSQVNQEASDLQNQILSIISRYSLYFFLIILYFAILQLIQALVDKFIAKEIIRDIIKGVATTLVFIATIITVLFAFVGNLTYLITGFGVISAALVVALQDFVSSFFAYVWIRVRSIYKTKDVIMADYGNSKVIGVVCQIGIFRTSLRELFYGLNEISTERASGRIISLPNNIMLKNPVVNFTHDNRLLWHTLELTITFESDFNLAKNLLEGIMENQFKNALDHKDQLLDDVYNLKYIYKPKVFMSISTNGPKFTIWFAVRYGHYQEVLEMISKDILNSFTTHGIVLAYNTSRIVRQQQQPSAIFDVGI